MSKYKQLHRRTLIEMGVIVGVIIASAVVMIITDGLVSGAERTRNEQQAKVQTLKSEIEKGTERLESSGASIALYDKLKQERDDMSLVSDRKQMTDLLTAMKVKYRLSSLNLQMTPEQPYEDEEIRSMKLAVVTSDVRLDFGGMSDQHLFSFITELRRRLPGFVRIKELTLNRNKAFDIEAMRQISQGAKLEMVSGTMAFQWFGYPESTKKEVAQ